MIPSSVGTLTEDTIEGPDAGLTITAVLLDGAGVRDEEVTVTPVLDAQGNPLDAYASSFTPLELPVMLRYLDGATILGEQLVSADVSLSVPGAPDWTTLEGAAPGLTITARLLGGNDVVLTDYTVLVSPVLDTNGLPLRAYRADYLTPTTLPFAIEWRQAGVRVGYELIATEPVDTDSALGRFRLLLGDLTDPYLFSASQAAYFIGLYSDVRLAVADAADALALRFARTIRKFTTDGQSFERGAADYTALAKALRAQVAGESGGLGTVVLTKVDALSNDISTRDSAYLLDATGRRSYGFYGSVDEP